MNADQTKAPVQEKKKSNAWIWILIVILIIVLAVIGVVLGFTIPTL